MWKKKSSPIEPKKKKLVKTRQTCVLREEGGGMLLSTATVPLPHVSTQRADSFDATYLKLKNNKLDVEIEREWRDDAATAHGMEEKGQ
mgnify:CR=1 FL=1